MIFTTIQSTATFTVHFPTTSFTISLRINNAINTIIKGKYPRNTFTSNIAILFISSPIVEKYTAMDSSADIKTTPKKIVKTMPTIGSLFLILVDGSGIAVNIDGLHDFVTASIPSFLEFNPVYSMIPKTMVTHANPCTMALKVVAI
ncbi:hypothetical protein D3C75_919660 [compost metagenome]